MSLMQNTVAVQLHPDQIGILPFEELRFDPNHVKFYNRVDNEDYLIKADVYADTNEETCSKVRNQITLHRHENTRFNCVRNLRIVLGHACNFRCKYCAQEHSEFKKITQQKLDELLKRCDANFWYEDLQLVQFWGGEPLLYWDAIAYLMKEFRKRNLNTGFSLVTNGSLMNWDITKHLLDEPNFGFVLSHDGPGQALRGIDPLRKGSESRECLLALAKAKCTTNVRQYANQGRNFAVNPVLTSQSESLIKIVEWYDETFQQEIPIAECIPMIPIQPGTEQYAPFWENMEAYENMLIETFYKLPLDRFDNYKLLYELFLQKLSMEDFEVNPTKALCFTTDPFMLTMDINGNVIPCPTFDADCTLPDGTTPICGTMKSDSVKQIFKTKLLVRMPVVHNWSTRLDDHGNNKCECCPALSFCMGGCPYLVGQAHEIDCKVKRHHFTTLLRIFIERLLGTNVTGFTK